MSKLYSQVIMVREKIKYVVTLFDGLVQDPRGGILNSSNYADKRGLMFFSDAIVEEGDVLLEARHERRGLFLGKKCDHYLNALFNMKGEYKGGYEEVYGKSSPLTLEHLKMDHSSLRLRPPFDRGAALLTELASALPESQTERIRSLLFDPLKDVQDMLVAEKRRTRAYKRNADA